MTNEAAVWFYSTDNQRNGRFSRKQIFALLSVGAITKHTRVWSETISEWTPLFKRNFARWAVPVCKAPRPKPNRKSIMKKAMIPLLAAIASSAVVGDTASAQRLTLECRGRKSPLDPYATARTIITLDFTTGKAYFNGYGESDITGVSADRIEIGDAYINRTNGEYFSGMSYMDCSLAQNQGF